MYNLKKFVAIAVVLLMSIQIMPCVNAQEVYQGEFIHNGYTFYDGENLSAAAYAESLFPLPGRTEIEVKFSADGNASGRICIMAKKYADENMTEAAAIGISSQGLIFETEGGSTQIAAAAESEKIYTAVCQIDFENCMANISLYAGGGKAELEAYKSDIALDKSCGEYGFCGVKLQNTSAEKLKVRRARCSGDKPYICFGNTMTVMGSETFGKLSAGDAYDAYAAVYDDNQSLKYAATCHGIYSGADNYVEAVFPQNDVFRGKNSVKFFLMRSGDMTPVTDEYTAEVSGAAYALKNTLVYTDFENCTSVPRNWAMQAWGADSPIYDLASDAVVGDCLRLAATDRGYRGIRSAASVIPQGGIDISFRVKASDDYEGNNARIVIIYFDENGSWKDENGKTYTPTIVDIDNLPSNVWTMKSVRICPNDYPSGAVRFQVGFCTRRSGDGTYGGYLYYDSVAASAAFSMKCDETLGWHGLGDTVVYRANSGFDAADFGIHGIVYNSDGEFVADIAANSGVWQFTPETSGYYKVFFEIRMPDGRVIREKMRYKAYYNSTTKKTTYIDKESHIFYVTAFENNADCGSRNPLYGLSIGNYDGEYDIDIADKVGMSFVRLHSISWKDIEPERGTYNWAAYDKIFGAVRSKNLDVIGNILWTPLWASPNSEGSVNDTWPVFASYAPTNSEYLTEFIDALYDRYGDAVNSWEIYNEPHISGGSVFWHDTVQNYVSMLAAAYGKLKAKSANADTVMMGGIGARRYLPFYRLFLENGGYSYTDKLAMHGYDIDPWNYLAINDSMNIESGKGVADTESHMILFNKSSDDMYSTEKELALRMLKEYLRQIKYGVEKIAFFQPYDNSVQAEDLMKLDSREENWSAVASGLFRKRPDFEPRFSAGVLNTLISVSGNSVEYCDEYKSGNINIVKLKADNSYTGVVWCDGLSGAENAPVLPSGAAVVDWEGRTVAAENFVPKADCVYFIRGLGEDAFSNLTSAQGDKVYNGEVLYSENEAAKKETSGLLGKSSRAPLFDSTDGCLLIDENKTEWNSMSYVSGTQSNCAYALYADNDGIECVVRTDGNAAYDNAKLVFGTDTFANGIQSDVVEITAEIAADSSAMIVKTQSPNIGGDIVGSDCCAKGEEVGGAKGYKTADGSKVYYCLYIPFGQLYPYMYTEEGSINMGINMIFRNSSGGETARYSWNSGTYSPYRPERFGTVNLSRTRKISASGGIELDINTGVGEYLTAAVYKENSLVYYNQYMADSDGKCHIRAALESDGSYVMKIYNRFLGYESIDIDYTAE